MRQRNINIDFLLAGCDVFLLQVVSKCFRTVQAVSGRFMVFQAVLKLLKAF